MPPPPDSVEVWDAQRVCSYEYIAVGEAREWIWEGPPTETAPEPSAVDSTAPSSSPFMVDGPAATVEAARSGDGELESINRAADELERWADRCRALVMELERKAAEEAEAAATGTDAKVKAMERRRLVALTVAATREAAPLGHRQAQQARGHDAAQLVAKMDEILARCPLAMAVLGGTPRPASPPPSTGTACHEAHETVETVVQAATVAGSESSSWHCEPGVEDSDEEGAELWRRISCHRSPSLVPPPLTEAEAAVTRKAARTEGGRTSAAQHHAISHEPDHEPSDHEPSDHERGGARERPRRYSRAVTVVALATVSVMSMLLVMLAMLVLLAEYQAWTRGRARALHEMQGHGSTRAASVLGLPLANLRNGSRLKQMLKASWRPIALGVATISVTDVVGALVIPTVGAWAAPLVAPAIAELRGRTAAARRAIEATLRGEIQSKASARSAAASKATSRAQAASVARAAREGRARAAEVVKAAERAVKAAAAETKAAAAAIKAAAAATKAAAEQAARDQATKAALRAARDKAAAEAVAATKAAAEQAARDQATKAALRAARDKAAAEAVAATKAAAAATEAVAEATKTVVEQTARDQAAVASLSMAIANDATAQEAAAAAYEEAAARAVTIGRVNPSDTMTSEATDTTMSTEDARETAGTSHEQESDVSRSTGAVANDSMALQTVQRVKILSLAGRVAASLLHAAWGVARAWDSTTGFIQKKLPPLVDRLNSGLRNYGKNARGSA